MVGVALEESVARALHTAKAAWPGFTLDDAAFCQTLQHAVAGDPEAARALDAMCVADLYLAQACAHGDRRAIEAFDREHLSQVPIFLARHPARAVADEVCQVLRAQLLLPRPDAPARIGDYAGRGALRSWLRVATLRAASNLTRGQRVHAPLDEGTPSPDAFAAAPELRVLEARYQQAFRAAFRGAFAALEPDERTVLKLHFVDGVTVRKLVPILGVSSATVGRRLQAAQQRLGELVIAQLATATDQPAAELESVVRALMSRLEVSLSALIS